MVDRGRPRSFDREKALRSAMILFWRYGYEGASLGDLTEAMGINRPSLYAAFGSKEALFREAIGLYDSTVGAPIEAALASEPTARASIEAVLRYNAQSCTGADTPRGCMIVMASLLGTAENEEIRAFLSETRRSGEEHMRLRIERGIAEGDVPAGADAAKMAQFYTTVSQGLSVQAVDGASCAALNAVVDGAMAAWDALAAPAAG
ncbi:TetR/AcrR family transcriptional regulator [Pelagibacterium xiamenense]|uniref:TetR/AcrR family transcriptional regulator n=1 Tax=Pelagibacterium xiamenense TaxID=2901140 RepID=UPI001E47D8B8|nr:TetR/AcrR family transcriptional regulator [Pelagibacterium xiamenense]MCD7059538.1 TetR/AcrR family transcriptional regulator [Pelagibacterium xiamenense]